MKIVEGLSQNTPEWKEWRRPHIGSSDAAYVMGFNQWQSKRSLWEQKVLGWEKEFDPLSIDRMKQGQEMEPIARKAYEELTGLIVSPLVTESTEWPFLAASFDGMNQTLDHAVEIKCGASSHKSARCGFLPAYYIMQVQHQMLVSGLQSIDYFSYYEGEGILIKVDRYEELIKELLEKEIEFWHHVQTGIPPED
jgi:putative phage-type endonuclease